MKYIWEDNMVGQKTVKILEILGPQTNSCKRFQLGYILVWTQKRLNFASLCLEFLKVGGYEFCTKIVFKTLGLQQNKFEVILSVFG